MCISDKINFDQNVLLVKRERVGCSMEWNLCFDLLNLSLLGLKLIGGDVTKEIYNIGVKQEPLLAQKIFTSTVFIN